MLIICPLNINTLKAGMANIISRRHTPISLPFKVSAPEIMQLKWTSSLDCRKESPCETHSVL
jgi:hypothetical protein